MHRRNGRTSDIEVWELIVKMFKYSLIYCVLAWIALWVGASVIDTNRNTDIEYNKFVEVYNELSEEDRALAAPYFKYSVAEGSLELEPKEVASEDYASEWKANTLPKVAVGAVVVLSLACFIWYVRERNSSYRISDLPFNHVIGWVLLLMMFVAWPILLIDRIIMSVKSARARYEERTAVVDEAERELREKKNLPFSILSNAKAQNYYVEYVTKWSQKAYKERKNELLDAGKKMEQNLKYFADEIRKCQSRRGEIQAELKKYEAIETREVIERRAEEEWNVIRGMRGVMGASVKKVRGKKSKELTIYVRVRVSYNNELYDFGDYKILLNGRGFECFCVRSGIRKDATSTAPSYGGYVGSRFCFGRRRNEIDAYMRTGRYVEAVTLMIDCLHSVNDSEDEEMIPYCFRKIKTVERAKKRLAKT